jgi:hypothetical protein
LNTVVIIVFPNNTSFPATIASRAISTGVEQGEEKIPPSIPAINAPTNPFLVFFEIR